ncbi:hypothetical protein BKA81DRAFT_382898 [Phyllosticta paracitricarpa]|uniref:Uncharacterized protein n=1 Tax=Phyllosticta paracitricarpa TaxID=2016321 RepID=A0ABR1MWI3_9PEZI
MSYICIGLAPFPGSQRRKPSCISDRDFDSGALLLCGDFQICNLSLQVLRSVISLIKDFPKSPVRRGRNKPGTSLQNGLTRSGKKRRLRSPTPILEEPDSGIDETCDRPTPIRQKIGHITAGIPIRGGKDIDHDADKEDNEDIINFSDESNKNIHSDEATRPTADESSKLNGDHKDDHERGKKKPLSSSKLAALSADMHDHAASLMEAWTEMVALGFEQEDQDQCWLAHRSVDDLAKKVEKRAKRCSDKERGVERDAAGGAKTDGGEK